MENSLAQNSSHTTNSMRKGFKNHSPPFFLYIGNSYDYNLIKSQLKDIISKNTQMTISNGTLCPPNKENGDIVYSSVVTLNQKVVVANIGIDIDFIPFFSPELWLNKKNKILQRIGKFSPSLHKEFKKRYREQRVYTEGAKIDLLHAINEQETCKIITKLWKKQKISVFLSPSFTQFHENSTDKLMKKALELQKSIFNKLSREQNHLFFTIIIDGKKIPSIRSILEYLGDNSRNIFLKIVNFSFSGISQTKLRQLIGFFEELSQKSNLLMVAGCNVLGMYLNHLFIPFFRPKSNSIPLLLSQNLKKKKKKDEIKIPSRILCPRYGINIDKKKCGRALEFCGCKEIHSCKSNLIIERITQAIISIKNNMQQLHDELRRIYSDSYIKKIKILSEFGGA